MPSVKLHAYDHRKDVWILRFTAYPIWHTAIVLYGREYFFSDEGICSCEPGRCWLNRDPDTIVDLKDTTLSEEDFKKQIAKWESNEFRGDKYNKLTHNCNNFTNTACQYLTGEKIPILFRMFMTN